MQWQCSVVEEQYHNVVVYERPRRVSEWNEVEQIAVEEAWQWKKDLN